jgi:hypothetical protein
MTQDPATNPVAVEAPGAGPAVSETTVFAVLLALSVVGIAISDFSPRYGLYYWLTMVPVFGLASLHSGWSRARKRGEKVQRILLLQALHWGVLALAVYLVFMLEETGRLNQEDAGLVALLALALTTLLAGVHFDWRLALLGALLGLAAACAAFVEEFFWLLLLPALVAAVVLFFWHGRGGEAVSSQD